MPGTARAGLGGVCYHVLNRGNARMRVFHRPDDFGSPEWAVRAAAQMGLEASLRPRGRPRLDPKEQQATK